MSINKKCTSCIYKTKINARLKCNVAIREGEKITKISEMKLGVKIWYFYILIEEPKGKDG